MTKETPTGVDLNEIRKQIHANARTADPLTLDMFPVTQKEHDALLEVNPELSEILPEGTWYAPQFFLQKGAELGYHCHVYRTIGEKDLGLMVTMVGDKVFIESHRVGKVKKSYSVDRIGEKDLKELVYQARHHLANVPDDARRMPSKKATFIGVYEETQIS